MTRLAYDICFGLAYDICFGLAYDICFVWYISMRFLPARRKIRQPMSGNTAKAKYIPA